ncbi:hypothetical protein OWV82_023412 [Melia azedarach]|uniref:Uncharacterized protein n=1 Tax=Melia azedarach TaxID=155640 RepID=A0ACC1WWI1_MELAZ|nr:hypothetical protein OWV82_023412 [Melia azedarach]
MDAIAENKSTDSLSFADLVCIKDQQSNPLPTRQLNKQDPEFEFSPATPKSTTHNLNTNSPTDVLMSNSQLQRHALLSQSEHSESKNQPTAESHNPHCVKGSQKGNHKVRNQAKKESTAKGSWFGRKLFQSFVSPCRECHARQPAAKAHTMPQENAK